MTVIRIVPNIASDNLEETREFYQNILGLKVVMDFGWIVTLASDTTTTPQISIASEGGSGAPVPDISIEVEDVEEVYKKVRTVGHEIVYDLRREEWGVKRFFVRDPSGKILNILSHDA